MKAIVVYFSLEGNTQYTAEKIKEYTGAELLRLNPVKAYPEGNFKKYFWCGKSATFGEKPKLEPYHFSADNYDVVIIGTPVWAGTLTPPVRTFISENNLSGKKVALFACNSGGSADKCFNQIKKELNNCEVAAVMELANPGVNRQKENEIKIEEFCNCIRKSI